MKTTVSCLFREKFQHKETICTITSDKPQALQVAKSSIISHREELEKYIGENPIFQYALQPIRVNGGPEVVRLMAEAGELAGVGPMAAVAGVLADLAVEAMLRAGARVAVVEDGGEASIVSDKTIDVALQVGDVPLSRRVGFRLANFPVGVATSSGVFSHALSLGEAEAVTVFAKNAGVADAVATAVANVVKGEAEQEVIEGAVKLGLSIEGVRGVFILFKGLIGMGGDIPDIIKVNPEEDNTIKLVVG
jgi:ApbE superfamily uncharacterized protein (UPF0280 family)